jgi:hypothetical protein
MSPIIGLLTQWKSKLPSIEQVMTSSPTEAWVTEFIDYVTKNFASGVGHVLGKPLEQVSLANGCLLVLRLEDLQYIPLAGVNDSMVAYCAMIKDSCDDYK